MFTGFARRNWISAQRIQIWRPHWETQHIQNKHYSAIFNYASPCCLIPIPFLFPSSFPFFLSFLIVFSSLKDRVSIHQTQGEKFLRLQCSLKPFKLSDLSSPGSGMQSTSVSFTVSKYGESIKSVNKMKGMRDYLGQFLWFSSDCYSQE